MSWTRLDPDLHRRIAAEEEAHWRVMQTLQAEPLNLAALRLALLSLSTAAEKAAQAIEEVPRG